MKLSKKGLEKSLIFQKNKIIGGVLIVLMLTLVLAACQPTSSGKVTYKNVPAEKVKIAKESIKS